MDPARQAPSEPVRHLGLADAMAVVVGIVVGAGIFRLPSLVAMFTAGPGLMFLAWVLGGLLCLCGALCYAELAAAYPRVGGEYVYLGRAFGGAVSFLFAWARATVIQTGAIAATAYVFGDYMARLDLVAWLVERASQEAPAGGALAGRLADLARWISASQAGPTVWALVATVVLTLSNLVGLRAGKWTQNVLTAVKVLGLAVVVRAAVIVGAVAPGAVPAAPPSEGAGDGPGLAAFGLAMVFVLYTYGGWNEAAYVAGELKGKRRNTLWLLIGSLAIITVLYLAVNAAYVWVLGFAGLAKSEAVAADVMTAAYGPWGGAAVSVLVAISALGAVNGCIFTGARAICGLGEDYRPLRALGRWHGRLRTPATAILVQGIVAVVLVVLPGLGGGAREALGPGFQAAVEYTSPVFWAFFLLTGVALVVLRVREPEVERPFRVPLFPVMVTIFCLTCGWMLYSSLAYTKAGALVGVGVLVAGVPVYLVCRRRRG